MKKILLIGGTIFARNRGVAALVAGCVNSLRKNLKNPEITLVHSFVESMHPVKTTSVSNVKILMDDETSFIKLIKLGLSRLFIVIVWRLLSIIHINAGFLLRRDKLLIEYSKSDVVINLSFGDIFAYLDNFYNKFLFFTLSYQSLLAILLGKKLVFSPQSIGPFRGRISTFLAKFILNHCELIMVREPLSKNLLAKLNVGTPVHLLPDLSFLLVPAPQKRLSEIFLEEKMDISHPLIGIAIRENMIRDLDVIAEVVDYLTIKLKAKVIFVPHTSIDPTDAHFLCYDPRFLAREIIKQLKSKENVYSIENDYTVEELRGIIGNCDVFFGGFMHANLSALSMCVPTLALSYSHKTEGIMSLVDLVDFVLPLDHLKTSQLINKIDELYANRDIIKEKLSRIIPKLTTKAMNVGFFVKQITEDGVD